MYRSPITRRFSATTFVGYYELTARVFAPTIAVLRPAPPDYDPANMVEIGRLRWNDTKHAPEFRGNDLPLSLHDVAVIDAALRECFSRAAFDRHLR